MKSVGTHDVSPKLASGRGLASSRSRWSSRSINLANRVLDWIRRFHDVDHELREPVNTTLVPGSNTYGALFASPFMVSLCHSVASGGGAKMLTPAAAKMLIGMTSMFVNEIVKPGAAFMSVTA